MDTFPLERDDSAKVESIKWTAGGSKYELYLPTLREMGIVSVTQYCFYVIHKINAIVGDDDDRKG